MTSPYPHIKWTLLGNVDLRGMRAVPFHKLECGETYALVGQFHAQRPDGALVACLRYAVTAVYQGQLTGECTRYLFLDTHDSTRLVATHPSETLGIVTTQPYRLKPARTSKLAG